MRTSITIPDEIYKTGLQNAQKRGFANSFSAYLTWLIQRDSEGGVSREDVGNGAQASKPIPYLRAAEDGPDTPR